MADSGIVSLGKIDVEFEMGAGDNEDGMGAEINNSKDLRKNLMASMNAACDGGNSIQKPAPATQPATKKKRGAASDSKQQSNKKKRGNKATTETKTLTNATQIKNENPEAAEEGAQKRTTVSKPISMPTCWEEAGQADRALFTMRDNGEDWEAIRQMWKNCTGQDTKASTLPTRYSRLKANFVRLQDGDEEILRNAKVEVEKKFADEKFSLIADSVEKNGGARYTALFIRNQIKKMDQSASNAKNSAAAAAAAAGGGIRDTVTPDED